MLPRCCTVGKIKACDDVALETQLESVDHDLILRNAMSACPGLLPSYQRLGEGHTAAVYGVASAAFNLGQFAASASRRRSRSSTSRRWTGRGWPLRPLLLARADQGSKGCENPNFRGSYLGRFPLVSTDLDSVRSNIERERL